jgi:hypothetical protein
MSARSNAHNFINTRGLLFEILTKITAFVSQSCLGVVRSVNTVRLKKNVLSVYVCMCVCVWWEEGL